MATEEESVVDRDNEEEFNLWLESIHFVDKNGKEIPVVLEDDDSPDPEGDREL